MFADSAWSTSIPTGHPDSPEGVRSVPLICTLRARHPPPVLAVAPPREDVERSALLGDASVLRHTPSAPGVRRALTTPGRFLAERPGIAPRAARTLMTDGRPSRGQGSKVCAQYFGESPRQAGPPRTLVTQEQYRSAEISRPDSSTILVQNARNSAFLTKAEPESRIR